MAKKRAAKKAASPELKDRIVELRRVRAGDLQPNPENWRTHGDDQMAALSGILGEVGIADAVLAFPADGLGPDGDSSKLMLFDGHARTERDPDQLWPVIVTDLTRDEARKMLAVTDPLAAMAGADTAKLAELVRTSDLAAGVLADMVAELITQTGMVLAEQADQKPEDVWAGGVPAYDQENQDQHRIVLHFKTLADRAECMQRLGLSVKETTRAAWYPPQQESLPGSAYTT